MLNVNPFQETLGVGVCAPATLKMLLTFFNLNGQELSDLELAKVCGTDPHVGTTNRQMIEAAEKFGLKCEEKYNASFEDIDKALNRGNPVVVDYFTPGRTDRGLGEMPDGHYSICVDLDEKYIYLQDPEIGGLRKILREDFLRVWFDFEDLENNFIVDVKNIYLRYMIEVSKK
jgi:ABC-type bacteriocin/lantibiotic exporter with double-glycine peptidase domain